MQVYQLYLLVFPPLFNITLSTQSQKNACFHGLSKSVYYDYRWSMGYPQVESGNNKSFVYGDL